MAESEQYHLSKPAAEISAIINGALRTDAPQNLSPQAKAQAVENLGIDADKLEFGIDGYFDTFDELTDTITNPSGGDSYGVGLAYPYDIYTWDALRGRWVNNGPIRGADGKDGEDGKDAELTAENIETALGYMPPAPDSINLEFFAVLLAGAWDNKQQTVSMPGLPEGCIYVADLDTSAVSTSEEIGTMEDAWKPLKVTCTANAATIIFSDVPSIDLPIRVWAARKE